MKLKEFKPVYPQVLLYATTYERNYIKVLANNCKQEVKGDIIKCRICEAHDEYALATTCE